MPELPEVETTVNGLRPVLQDQRITLIQMRRPDLRRPLTVVSTSGSSGIATLSTWTVCYGRALG